jgi:hypothetical protein
MLINVINKPRTCFRFLLSLFGRRLNPYPQTCRALTRQSQQNHNHNASLPRSCWYKVSSRNQVLLFEIALSPKSQYHLWYLLSKSLSVQKNL